MSSPLVLENKVVAVSGVGPGLGRSIAVQSAKAGADLVLAARTESRLDEVAAEVKDLGRRVITVRTDVNDDASAQNLVEVTLAE
jgi:NADP-dependent 3-hydroxy acid dehydrogenase YdfG